MIKIYGISSCDKVRKAKKFLNDNDKTFDFINLKEGIDYKSVKKWCDSLGFENILNRKSTTWRSLSDEEKNNIDENNAIALMLKYPTLIKRPIIESQSNVFVGVTEI